MLPPQRPIHAERLRDALGLLRLLYAAEAQRGADPARLEAITEGGRLLMLALEQTRYELGSLAHRAAPGNATKGFGVVAKLELGADVLALVETARRRALEDASG